MLDRELPAPPRVQPFQERPSVRLIFEIDTGARRLAKSLDCLVVFRELGVEVAGIRQLIKPVGRGQNGCLRYRERTAVPLTWR